MWQDTDRSLLKTGSAEQKPNFRSPSQKMILIVVKCSRIEHKAIGNQSIN